MTYTTSCANADPYPTERGRGSELHPHGYESDSAPAEPQWELPEKDPFLILKHSMETPLPKVRVKSPTHASVWNRVRGDVEMPVHNLKIQMLFSRAIPSELAANGK